MALTDIYDARYNHSILMKRVVAQCSKSAQDILVESAATTNHNNRIIWAQNTLENPQNAAEKMMWYLANNATVLGHTSPDDTTDGEIQTIINSNIDNVAQ